MRSEKGHYGKKLIIVTLFFMLLTGCVFQTKDKSINRFSNKLEKKINQENEVKAQEWFQKNMPDAEQVSASAYRYFDKISSNAVKGMYMKNDHFNHFYLNVEDGVCLTDEQYGKCSVALRKKIANELGVDADVIKIYSLEQKFNYSLVSDRDKKGKRLKTKEYEEMEECLDTYVPWNMKDTDIDSYVEEAIHREILSIYIRVNKYSDAKNVFINKDFIEKYPNICIYVSAFENENKDIQYSLERMDNTYVWSKKTVDENGEVQYENIKPEDVLD